MNFNLISTEPVPRRRSKQPSGPRKAGAFSRPFVQKTFRSGGLKPPANGTDGCTRYHSGATSAVLCCATARFCCYALLFKVCRTPPESNLSYMYHWLRSTIAPGPLYHCPGTPLPLATVYHCPKTPLPLRSRLEPLTTIRTALQRMISARVPTSMPRD